MNEPVRAPTARRSAPRAIRVAAAAAFAVAMVVPSALGLAAVVVSLDGSTAQARPTTSFVIRSGSALLLGGATFRFVGFNLYNAAASDLYSCLPTDGHDDAQLDAAMQQISDSGGTVVRFWAFQSYTRGGTDYAGVDRVLAAAKAHGLHVLPVLENQWANCSRPGRTPLSVDGDGSWFTDGYRSALPNQPLSFREYASRITRHYRDDPTVFAWSLMNEAETHQFDTSGRSVLVDFAGDMATVVHAADPNHLLTLGTQSNGAPGASGADFTDVYGLPGLDLAEVHDWANRGSDTEAMPGAPSPRQLPSPEKCQAPTAQIACSFALAQRLGKPIIIAEAGIAADGRRSRATRARQLQAKMDAAFTAGASGYLVWHLNTTNTDGYGVLIDSADPLYDVLREEARRWASGRAQP